MRPTGRPFELRAWNVYFGSCYTCKLRATMCAESRCGLVSYFVYFSEAPGFASVLVRYIVYRQNVTLVHNGLEETLFGEGAIWAYVDALRIKTRYRIYKQPPILRHVTERIGEMSLKVNEATKKLLYKNILLRLQHGNVNSSRKLTAKYLIHCSVLGLSCSFIFSVKVL